MAAAAVVPLAASLSHVQPNVSRRSRPAARPSCSSGIGRKVGVRSRGWALGGSWGRRGRVAGRRGQTQEGWRIHARDPDVFEEEDDAEGNEEEDEDDVDADGDVDTDVLDRPLLDPDTDHYDIDIDAAADPDRESTGEGGDLADLDDIDDVGDYGLDDEEQELPMRTMTLAELLSAAGTPAQSIEGEDDQTVITGIAHDSREVLPGDAFVCVRGLTVNGHAYARVAAEAGAAALITCEDVGADLANITTVVKMTDTSDALPKLAAAFYGDPSKKLVVAAVTGTNGKTTTSYLLRGIMEAWGKRCGLIGTIGYSTRPGQESKSNKTTPDAVKLQQLLATMLHNECAAVCMEASSHALALRRCDAVDFDVAVSADASFVPNTRQTSVTIVDCVQIFTNLTRDHMDFHDTFEGYRAAKARLFEFLTDPSRQRGVINIDDREAPFFKAACKVPVVTFATVDPSADVYPTRARLSLFETDLQIRTPNGTLEFSSGLVGRMNVSNICAAVAAGIALGVPLESIVAGLESVDGVPGRAEVVDEGQPYSIIVDYAHTPDALERLLDSVRECGANKIICVFGCGGDRDKGKRSMMGRIAAAKANVTFITSDNPRTEDPLAIIGDIQAGMSVPMGKKDKRGHIYYVVPRREEAIRGAVAMASEGDVVVIAGKGHEDYQIVGAEVRHFSDREEASRAITIAQQLHDAGFDTRTIPWKKSAQKEGKVKAEAS
eukprot:jgi/Chlat1/1948/Chrsp157S02264